ncbi:hypothetical protein BDC45DRAFT_542777, partial [Circinella umbellata]
RLPTITLDCLSPKATGQQSLWTVFRRGRRAKDHFKDSFAEGDWPTITLRFFRQRRLAKDHFKDSFAKGDWPRITLKILSPKATGQGLLNKGWPDGHQIRIEHSTKDKGWPNGHQDTDRTHNKDKGWPNGHQDTDQTHNIG